MTSLLIQEHVSLAPWTTLGVGGPARYFIEAFSENDVRRALDFAASNSLPVFVLGGGSNLLVADKELGGVVLRISIKGMEWEPSGDDMLLRAGAGEEWDPVVAACVDRNLAGIECLSGIPGLVGGTPVQNVGAYGQETDDVLVSVRTFDRDSESIVELTSDECGFGYRSSIFNTTAWGRYIVLQVSYVLQRNGMPLLEYEDVRRRFESRPDPPSLADVRNAVREIRASKGMLVMEGDPDSRSAGSFFKNPTITESEYLRLQGSVSETVPRYPARTGMVKTSAAWLIERSGFHRGFSIGPAAVSPKHTLALINRGGATAADIVRLARKIRDGVAGTFGIKLLPEPVFVGFDDDF